MTQLTLINALLKPHLAFKEIAQVDSNAAKILQKIVPLLLLAPPIFVWLGSGLFGWRMGADEALFLDNTSRVIISFCYFIALSLGFFSTVFIAHWMGVTYGADKPLKVYFALITVVYFPFLIGSIAHIYPNAFFNLLVLLLTLIWCMTLLYKGLPVALEIPPERGMLMSSSLVAWLLVGAVSLLGISVGLWTIGIGPAIAV
ncbi:DUF1282 family protein [Haliea sp. AH-315-K21]|uniref:Yip1 domain-containing protein n=1 Tax=SAR86 cluster bacterium TaxID=2030880 RepID=A0A2A5CK69_9GAMM|nr:DUF1282 family protein [Haliea sp. AH-315-K21]MBN4075236.1 DUF1282 family protein [Gammaproteobacteria bacterium AH-315-E17]PCJ43766.1 MAG: hypothetical protein COA71_02555 [SAR86 cluster bacterium]